METISGINYDIINLENQLNFLNNQVNMDLYKRCYKCTLYKFKKTDFHIVKGKYKRICKSCCSAYSKQYYINKKANKTN